MSLQINLTNFATRIATEFKSLRTLVSNNAGNLDGLTTTQKSNLVAAINELDAAIDTVAANAGAINDAATSTASTWSSNKTAAAIAALVNDAAESGPGKTYSVEKILALIAAAKQAVKDDLVNGAGSALDTLKELSDALGGDANFATTMTNAIANRVRHDSAQTLSAAQKLQACNNIGIGDPETDLVATFNAGLV